MRLFCQEFIHLVSSESNEVCEKESRKTISPDHVLTALKVCHPTCSITAAMLITNSKALGYERYIPELEEVLKDHKQLVKTVCSPRASLFTPLTRVARIEIAKQRNCMTMI